MGPTAKDYARALRTPGAYRRKLRTISSRRSALISPLS
jgi:hypothetical protein